MIKHTVFFRLKHASNSDEEKLFFKKANDLANISGVKNFSCLRQISNKNHFTFGLYMEFDDQSRYDYYNDHPDHVDFVENVWLNEVNDFMEIDYVGYSQS